MEHLSAVLSAVKASAPIVAIPVEGHAPVCIRRKLLAGALKGVTISSINILLTPGGSRLLHIEGRSGELTKTSCKIVALNRITAMMELRDWSERQRAKQAAINAQGILSPKEQRALKLKQAEAAGALELKAALRAQAEIIAEAKRYAKQEITPVHPEQRASIIESYSIFRRGDRKRASVILYQMGKLQAQVEALTTVKTVMHRRGRRIEKINKVNKPANVPLVAGLMAQIGALKAQFHALYPKRWEISRIYPNGGYWQETFSKQRPTMQVYYFAKWKENTFGETLYNITEQAAKLREARADIRALTPLREDSEGLSAAA